MPLAKDKCNNQNNQMHLMPTAKGKCNNQIQSNALNTPQQKVSAKLRRTGMYLIALSATISPILEINKIQDRCHRYGEQHAPNPEHVSENDGGDQNRDAGYAKRA